MTGTLTYCLHPLTPHSAFPQMYCFDGKVGNFTVELPNAVHVSSIILSHNARFKESGPRRFKVVGFPLGSREMKSAERENGNVLGTYLYDNNSGGSQEFNVHTDDQPPFKVITVMVIAGGTDNLCLERLMVHGREATSSNSND